MLYLGDCMQVLKELPDDSIDSLVTDAPAGIAFMGKAWDEDKGGRDQWIAWLSSVMKEALRVLKPGAHGLVWAIPRTSHWTATALEDAGFEIRDVVTHLFGQGFPKASALNRAKSGVFCQCVSNKYNTENTSDAPRTEAHIDNVVDVSCDALGSSSAFHSMGIAQDSLADYQKACDSCGGQPHLSEFCDPALSRSQQYVQARNHSDGHGDVQEFESSCNLSSAQCTTHLSNKDCFCQKNIYVDSCPDIGESKVELVSKPTLKDSEISAHHTLNTSSQPLASQFDTGFPASCQTCKKPNVDGWYNGGLKPAAEFWVLVRKPISEKTVAANVLKHGVGGINIDGCRIGPVDPDLNRKSRANKKEQPNTQVQMTNEESISNTLQGRFPANLVFSHNEDCDDKCSDGCAVASFDEQSGDRPISARKNGSEGKEKNAYAERKVPKEIREGDSGGASRFFYCAKSSKADKGKDNTHPTPKNTKLMQYLIRLVTPKGGVVLDPFMGSGSTGVAAIKEGFGFIGIEREEEYLKIAQARIDASQEET